MLVCFQASLPIWIGETELVAKYSSYGNITEISVVRKKNAPSVENYAFIRFDNIGSTYKALDDPSPPVFTNPQSGKTI